jgi:hypothetical protein
MLRIPVHVQNAARVSLRPSAALIAFVLLVACGRIGFDPLAGGDAGRLDGLTNKDGTVTATWSVVQVTGTTADYATIASSGAGNLIVVAAKVQQGDKLSSVTDDAPGGSSVYVAVPKIAMISVAGGEIDVWYTTSAHAGAMQITATSSAGPGFVYAVVAWEVSGLAANELDTDDILSEQAASSSPLGPALTPRSAGEFIIAAEVGDGNVTGIAPGNAFVEDNAAMLSGNGWAHLPGSAATAGAHQAQWLAGSGAYCSSAVAFGP